MGGSCVSVDRAGVIGERGGVCREGGVCGERGIVGGESREK